MRHRGRLQRASPGCSEVDELIDQARLPDAGLPDAGDDLAVAGLGPSSA